MITVVKSGLLRLSKKFIHGQNFDKYVSLNEHMFKVITKSILSLSSFHRPR